MTPVSKWVDARPDDVWAILADPRAYALWVVGSHDITGVDGPWPSPGATFEHVQGHGPIKLSDTTTVLEVRAPQWLKLEVRIRPLLVAEVELSLETQDGGTCITIDEYATGGLGRLAPRLVSSPIIAFRNSDALRRLAAMAWTRAHALPERGAIAPAHPLQSAGTRDHGARQSTRA